MGRRRKQPTRMVRIRISDLNRLRALAKLHKLSLGDYIAKVTWGKR